MDVLSVAGLVILTTFSPIVEINGSIPVGISLGLDPLATFLLAISANILIFFPVFFGLKITYKNFFSRIRAFNRYLEKTRKKGKPYIDKYGYIGLALFMALPSPLTGVYTGSLLAWLLNMEWKKSIASIFLGVLINGVIILGVVLGLFSFLKFLIY